MIFLTILIAYLMGSIASSVWVGQLFYGIDVREYGSGNAGATNTIRVLGIKAGIPVLLLDVLKGFFAVYLVYLMPGVPDSTDVKIILGIASVLGHIFPVYVGFRGGKGIATLLGIVVAIHPYAALLSIATFAVIFIISRYVSLSSMLASLAFPFWIIFKYKETELSMIIFSVAVAILVLITHQKNIERLINKEESRISFSKKGNDDNE